MRVSSWKNDVNIVVALLIILCCIPYFHFLLFPVRCGVSLLDSTAMSNCQTSLKKKNLIGDMRVSSWKNDVNIFTVTTLNSIFLWLLRRRYNLFLLSSCSLEFLLDLESDVKLSKQSEKKRFDMRVSSWKKNDLNIVALLIIILCCIIIPSQSSVVLDHDTSYTDDISTKDRKTLNMFDHDKYPRVLYRRSKYSWYISQRS